MTETVSIALPADAWVQISSGQSNVTAQLATIGLARVFIGTAEPEGIVGLTMTSDGYLSFSEVSGNVYLRAVDAANAAWVVRG